MRIEQLQRERTLLRVQLRRGAWEQIGQGQALDLEHLLAIAGDYAGGNRGRLVAQAFIAHGLKAMGATDAQIGAALTRDAAGVEHLLTGPLLADPAIAAAVERAVKEQLPATLLIPDELDPEDRARARTNPESLLR